MGCGGKNRFKRNLKSEQTDTQRYRPTGRHTYGQINLKKADALKSEIKVTKKSNVTSKLTSKVTPKVTSKVTRKTIMQIVKKSDNDAQSKGDRLFNSFSVTF